MSQPLSRRVALQVAATLAVGTAGAALLAACGVSGTAGATQSAASAPATTTASAAPATVASTTAAKATAIQTTAAIPTASATSSAAAATGPKPTATPRILGTGKKAAVTLEWFINYNDQDPKVIQEKFLPAFEQANSGVAVEAIIGPGGIIDAQEKYLAMTAAGTPPDLFNVTRPVANLARQGIYTDLTPLISRDKFDTTKYNQALYGYESTLGGKVYGLPLSVQAEAVAMAYNRDLFRKASVEEPPAKWGDAAWGWENFVEAARKLTVMADQNTMKQAGIDSLAYNVHLPVLWEGTWVSARLDQATCDSAAMVDTYTNYFDLSSKYKVMPGLFGLKAPGGGFKAGGVAMTTVGSWTFAKFRDMPIDWGFAPWPTGKRSTYAHNPEEGSIAKESKHVEETWTFLKWLDADSRYPATFDFMPMVTADAAKWAKTYFAGRSTDARAAVLSDGLVVAQPTDPIFLLSGSDDFIRTTIEPGLSKQIPGGASVTTTLQSIKGPLQQLVNRCACSGSAPPY